MDGIKTLLNKKNRCVECKKLIKSGEKAVALITYTGKSIHQEVYFHVQCYHDWQGKYAKQLAQKMLEESAPKALSKAMGLAPELVEKTLKKMRGDSGEDEKTPIIAS